MDTEGYVILIKGIIHQEDIISLNVYMNVSSFIKQVL